MDASINLDLAETYTPVDILENRQGLTKLCYSTENERTGTISSHRMTSAVTRSWSDVNHVAFFGILAATSFSYNVIGQPLFLAIARQQCARNRVPAREVLLDMLRTYGVRGLYRGAGAAIVGSVLSELLYYMVVEYCKEKLPMAEREWRSFGAGLLADMFSTPILNPFVVVSQVQMVASSTYSSEHSYMSAWRTAAMLVREQGASSLFRGTLLTLAVTPLTGAWWFVYELFKGQAYHATVSMDSSALFASLSDVAWLPECCTSRVDNMLINCSVGAAASLTMGVIMNPIYVLRMRLQVYRRQRKVRYPIFYILDDILKHEGPRALWKGLGINLFMAMVGGCVFGMTYETAKKYSDTTDPHSATPGKIQGRNEE